MSDISLEKLQQSLGHQFKDTELLRCALTHSSVIDSKNYERLEFLGDRVLGLVIAELLYKKFPNEQEGDMAKRLASLVQGSFLAEIAAEIHLDDYILVSDAERAAGGAANVNILADVFEALTGAMYLDGGYEVCQRLIESLWGTRFYEMKKPPQHPKTALQEWAQSRSLSLPVYELVEQKGPDHAPLFLIRVSLEGFKPVEAEGRSRQEAEKLAATAFIAAHNIKAD